jgi:alcohol dehydrogenase
MTQLVVTGPNRLEWREPRSARIEADTDVIIRPTAVSRCDVDIPVIAGGLQIPIVIGHEFVGQVIEVGDAVRSFRPGQRVASAFAISCGACRACARGAHHSCHTVEKPAYFGFGAYGHDWGGVVTDRVRLPFADAMLTPLPDNVSDVAAASAGDNLADAYRAIVPHLHQIPEGRVVVVGGGSPSIGLYSVAWAKWAGASVIDYWDNDPRRLALAERLGGSAKARAHPDPGRHYDIAMHASGRAEGLLATLRALDFGAKLTSSYVGSPQVTLPYMEVFTTGVQMTFGDQNTRANLPAVLQALAGGFDPTAIIAEVADWVDAADAFLSPAAKLVIRRDGIGGKTAGG